MYYESFGDKHNLTVLMLPGAFFTNTFGRQYVLQDRYHIVVPDLMGFGREAGSIFEADEQIARLMEFCQQLERPALVGFSLGAQLAFRLLSEAPERFSSAVIVSPWLVDKDVIPPSVMNRNLKIFAQLQSRMKCTALAVMNGMPRDQRRIFVENMQHVREETVRNSVDNGISFESVPAYQDVDVPILALAGSRETDAVKKSVRRMAADNPHCVSEIWQGAAHNIPPVHYKRFNKRLVEFLG